MSRKAQPLEAAHPRIWATASLANANEPALETRRRAAAELHPDLAKDAADRQLRELHLKQINAAWEIIQGKRGEV